MPRLHETTTRQLQQSQPSPLLEALVLDPPVDPSGFLRVEVDAQPGVVQLCPWLPRADVSPLPGDAAAVTESDRGTYWCLQWWPQSGQVPTDAATQAELDAHAALKTGTHGIPAMSNGQGLLWNGTDWVATDVATQSELDAVALMADMRLDALEALTPFIRATRSGQALGAGAWAIATGLATSDSQGISGFMTQQTDHIQIDAAGVYIAELEGGSTATAGDHLLMISRYASAVAIAGNGAGAIENRQNRTGATTNTSLVAVTAPMLCVVGDKISGHLFSTNAGTGSWSFSVSRVGP